MLLRISLILTVFAAFIGCKTSKPAPPPPPAEPTILAIGNKKFTTDEFFQSFTKNQFSDDTTKPTDITEYLRLYTNLKLKVAAAEQRGMDTLSTFKEEITSYRKVLAQPYLTDKVLTDNLVAEAYERLKDEIRASHILVAVARDAAPADTLAAYRAATALRSQILQNEITFEEAAKRYSKDLSSASAGGDLGFFTAFQLVYPLENVAYKLPKGKVSDLVRTHSGYHILKVTDRRLTRGRVQVAHLLVRVSSAATEEGKAAAKTNIDRAHELLKQESWDIVCRDYSDDATTKNNGGVLREFGTGEWMPIFEEKAFGLQQIGDISEPFLTNYGWHIIKLLAKKPVPSFDEMAPQLRAKVKTDTRGDLLQQTLVSKLRNTYKINELTSIKEAAFKQIDTTLLKGQWKYKEPLGAGLEQKPLFEIDAKAFTVNQFYEYIGTIQEPVAAQSSLSVLLNRYYQTFQNKALVETEENNLEKKHPEFRHLMAEMHDGVLLSQLMEANVWEKSLTDSLAQKALWEQTKDKYRYPERAVATIITADNDSLMARAQTILATSPYALRRKGADILFGTDASTPNAQQQEAVFDVALTLLNNPAYSVEVSAYQEDTEKDDIASLRLQKVVNLLTQNGVAPSRITEKNYGKFKPVPDANRNRRVSFQYFSTSPKDVEKALNVLKIGKISINRGLFAQNANEFLTKATWQTGAQYVNVNGKKAWVNITEIQAARTKTFAEARGAVINELQKTLEKNWLEQLRQQFPVQINEEELRKLVK
ncbi:MAG: peptidylprolyl isomerase [Spirosomaceae bacterium]|nr:peptidylprolyl isomerase [Spirosomataceae bacterium]